MQGISSVNTDYFKVTQVTNPEQIYTIPYKQVISCTLLSFTVNLYTVGTLKYTYILSLFVIACQSSHKSPSPSPFTVTVICHVTVYILHTINYQPVTHLYFACFTVNLYVVVTRILIIAV